MSISVKPSGLQPARLLCPWDSPSKNTGVGYYALLQYLIITAHKKGKAYLFCLHISSPNQHCSVPTVNSSIRVTLMRKGKVLWATSFPTLWERCTEVPLQFPFTQTSKAETYRDAARNKGEKQCYTALYNSTITVMQ